MVVAHSTFTPTSARGCKTDVMNIILAYGLWGIWASIWHMGIYSFAIHYYGYIMVKAIHVEILRARLNGID